MGNIEQMASAISRVLNDPALALRLGKAARLTVMERFTIGSSLEAIYAAYERLLRSRKRAELACQIVAG
jgi:glycosyltransferase involved in cell wall biosynthesis